MIRRLFGLAIGIAFAAGFAKFSRSFRFRHFLERRVVLITGGSRGLGIALARRFVAKGADVALIARDPAELQRAATDLQSRGARKVTIWPCDARDPVSLSLTVRSVAREHGRLDVLVNNAGVIVVAPLKEMTTEDFDDCLKTHFWAPYHATMSAAPFLRRQPESRVVNIASFGGRIAVPHMAPYSATKFALVGLSDALRSELAADGIKVTTVCPGLMRVGSHVNAKFKGDHDKEFTWFSLGMAMPFLSMNGNRAARQIVDACATGRPELTITFQARAAVIVQALFPGLMASVMKTVNFLLPRSTSSLGASETRKGTQCGTILSPSPLTILADRSSHRFNELHP